MLTYKVNIKILTYLSTCVPTLKNVVINLCKYLKPFRFTVLIYVNEEKYEECDFKNSEIKNIKT